MNDEVSTQLHIYVTIVTDVDYVIMTTKVSRPANDM